MLEQKILTLTYSDAPWTWSTGPGERKKKGKRWEGRYRSGHFTAPALSCQFLVQHQSRLIAATCTNGTPSKLELLLLDSGMSFSTTESTDYLKHDILNFYETKPQCPVSNTHDIWVANGLGQGSATICRGLENLQFMVFVEIKYYFSDHMAQALSISMASVITTFSSKGTGLMFSSRYSVTDTRTLRLHDFDSSTEQEHLHSLNLYAIKGWTPLQCLYAAVYVLYVSCYKYSQLACSTE